MTQYIVIYGNIVDGMSFVGPFETHDAALRFINGDYGVWLIAPIELPPEGDEQ